MKLRHKLLSYFMAGVMTLTSVVTASVMMSIPAFAASDLTSRIIANPSDYYHTTGVPTSGAINFAVAVYLCGDKEVYDGNPNSSNVVSACQNPGTGQLMQYRSEPIFFFPTLDSSNSSALGDAEFVDYFSGQTSKKQYNVTNRAIFSNEVGSVGDWGKIINSSIANTITYNGSTSSITTGTTLLSNYKSYRQGVEFDPDKEYNGLIDSLLKKFGEDSPAWIAEAHNRYTKHEPVTLIFELYLKYGDSTRIADSLWMCYHASKSYKAGSAWEAPTNSNLYGVADINAGAIAMFGGNTMGGVTVPTNAGRGLSPSYYDNYKLEGSPLIIDPNSSPKFQGGWAYYSFCNNFDTTSLKLKLTKDIEAVWAPGTKEEDKKNFSLSDFKAATEATYSVSPIITLNYNDNPVTGLVIDDKTSASNIAALLYTSGDGSHTNAMTTAVTFAQQSAEALKARGDIEDLKFAPGVAGDFEASAKKIKTTNLETIAFSLTNLATKGKYAMFIYESSVSSSYSGAEADWEKPLSGIVITFTVEDGKYKIEQSKNTNLQSGSTLEFSKKSQEDELLTYLNKNKVTITPPHIEPPTPKITAPIMTILDVDDYWLTGYSKALVDSGKYTKADGTPVYNANDDVFGYKNDKQLAYTHSASINVRTGDNAMERAPFTVSWSFADAEEKGINVDEIMSRVMELADEDDDTPLKAGLATGGGTASLSDKLNATGAEYLGFGEEPSGDPSGTGTYYYDFSFVNPDSKMFKIYKTDYYPYVVDLTTTISQAATGVDNTQFVDEVAKPYIGVDFKHGDGVSKGEYFYTLANNLEDYWLKYKWLIPAGSATWEDPDVDRAPWVLDEKFVESITIDEKEIAFGGAPGSNDDGSTVLPKGEDVTEGEEGMEIKPDNTELFGEADFTKSGRFTADEIKARLMAYSDYAKAYSSYEALVVNEAATVKYAMMFWETAAIRAYAEAKKLMQEIKTPLQPDRSSESAPAVGGTTIVSGISNVGWIQAIPSKKDTSANKYVKDTAAIAAAKNTIANTYSQSCLQNAEDLEKTLQEYSKMLERICGWKLEYCIPYREYAANNVSEKVGNLAGQFTLDKCMKVSSWGCCKSYKAAHVGASSSTTWSVNGSNAGWTKTGICVGMGPNISIDSPYLGSCGIFNVGQHTWTEQYLYDTTDTGSHIHRSKSGSDTLQKAHARAHDFLYVGLNVGTKRYLKSDGYGSSNTAGVKANTTDVEDGYALSELPQSGSTNLVYANIIKAYLGGSAITKTNTTYKNWVLGGYIKELLDRKYELEGRLIDLELNRPHAEVHIYTTYELNMGAPYKPADVEQWLLSMYWSNKQAFYEDSSYIANVLDAEARGIYMDGLAIDTADKEVDVGDNTEEGEYLARRDREEGMNNHDAIFGGESGTSIIANLVLSDDAETVLSGTSSGKSTLPSKFTYPEDILGWSSPKEYYRPTITFTKYAIPKDDMNKLFDENDMDTWETIYYLFNSAFSVDKGASWQTSGPMADENNRFHFTRPSFNPQPDWGLSIMDKENPYTYYDALAYAWSNFETYTYNWAMEDIDQDKGGVLRRQFPKLLAEQTDFDAAFVEGNTSTEVYTLTGDEGSLTFEDGDQLANGADVDGHRATIGLHDWPDDHKAEDLITSNDTPAIIRAGAETLYNSTKARTGVYFRYMQTLLEGDTAKEFYWMLNADGKGADKVGNFMGLTKAYNFAMNWYCNDTPAVVQAKFHHYMTMEIDGLEAMRLDDFTGIDSPTAAMFFGNAVGYYSRDDEWWAVNPLVKYAYYKESSGGRTLDYTYLLGQRLRQFTSNVYYSMGLQGVIMPKVQINQPASAGNTAAGNLNNLKSHYSNNYSGGTDVPVTYTGTGISIQYDTSKFIVQVQSMNLVNKDAATQEARQGNLPEYQQEWINDNDGNGAVDMKILPTDAHTELLTAMGAKAQDLGDGTYKWTIPYQAATDLAITDGNGNWRAKGLESGLKQFWMIPQPNKSYAVQDVANSYAGQILIWAEKGEITKISVPSSLAFSTTNLPTSDDGKIVAGEFVGKTTADTVAALTAGGANSYIAEGLKNLGVCGDKEIAKAIFEYSDISSAMAVAKDFNGNAPDKLDDEGSAWYNEYCHIIAVNFVSTAFRLTDTAMTDKIPVEAGPATAATQDKYFTNGWGLRADKLLLQIGTPSASDFHGVNNIINSNWVLLTRKYNPTSEDENSGSWVDPAGATYVDVIVSDVPTTGAR